jgi:PAS domain S-box-containing protein
MIRHIVAIARRAIAGLSLAPKLTLLSTVASLASMTVLGALLGWYDASMLREHLVDDTRILVSVIGANSTAAVAFGDTVAAQETLRSIARNPEVQRAAFILPDGTILSQYDRPGSTPGKPVFDRETVQHQSTWHVFRDAVLVVATPVILKHEVVGIVYVELSLAELHARTAKLWRTIVLAIVATVCVAGVLAWKFQRIVSAPLLRLTQITRSVTRNRDYSVRAVVEGSDEVAELMVGFNDMLDHIQRRDQTLEEHRQVLEQTVEARTAELKANMERFKVMVESTQAVPWEVDTETYTFSYVSPQVTKLFGYETESLRGCMTLWDLVHPDDRSRVQRQVCRLSADEADLDTDYRVITADQRLIDVRSVVSACGAREGGAVVLRGITIDVTQQKKLEFELRQAQKLESVGRLASGVAHEINTPVQFVSDSVHFVRDGLADLTLVLQKYRDGALDVAQAEEDADLPYLLEKLPQALDRSLEGLNRVAVIVRSMKEFAHPDRKEMTAVDLNQAIRSTLIIARNEYKYVADVETDLAELPPVTCHSGDINQAILNIVINAAHAIGDMVKGTDTKGCIAVSTQREDEAVVIRIRDTGGGIPATIRDRVFDPFFTTKEVGKGTGQGLAIARSVILEKHGGDLSFETEAGQGTTFVIRLPIAGKHSAVQGVAA